MLFAGFLPLVARAVDAVATPTAPGTGNVTADNLIQWLTPVLTPILIALMKKILPMAPAWICPIVAPLLGIGIDYLNHFATGHATNMLVAAGLGLMGVGLREVKDQLMSAPNGGWPAPPAA